MCSSDLSNSIYVKSAGYYSVITDCISSDSIYIAANSCSNFTLNLRLFIEGFYLSGQVMQPVLYNNGLSTNPNACDSITCELYSSSGLFIASKKALLLIDGTCLMTWPSSLLGTSYYIVVKTRNGIETWSKQPVLLNSAVVNYNFKQ